MFASASKFVQDCGPRKGYITMKSEQVSELNFDKMKDLVTYDEFHPLLFRQHADHPFKEFPTFDQVKLLFFQGRGGDDKN